MAKNSFHIQKNFTKSNQIAIKKIYKIPSEENILLAFWSGHLFSLKVRELGFVFTDKAFYWNYPTTTESGNTNENTLERQHATSGVLNLDTTNYLLSYSKQDPSSQAIIIKTSEFSYIFQFDSLPQNSALLESSFRNYFTHTFDSSTFEEEDESYSIRFTILLLKDWFVETFDALKTKTSAFIKNLKNKQHKSAQDKKINESSGAETETAHQNKKENSSQSKSKTPPVAESKPQNQNNTTSILLKIGHFVRHAFDFAADLIYLSFAIILAKPELLGSLQNKVPDWWPTNWDKVIFYGAIFFLAFLLIKIPVMLSCRKSRKAISILLLIILASVIPLINYTFFFFILLTLLILVTMQFSMGFNKSVIQTKICLFIICSICGYITIPLVQNPDLCQEIARVFSLPAKWF